MSLPDTAQYWNDVKSNDTSYINKRVHLKGRPCKKMGGSETSINGFVSCRKCKKIMKINSTN